MDPRPQTAENQHGLAVADDAVSSSAYLNPLARTYRLPHPSPASQARAFHARCLPSYTPTPLIPLPSLANELDLGTLFLKDESARASLPAFKILGASWGVYRALCARYGLSAGVTGSGSGPSFTELRDRIVFETSERGATKTTLDESEKTTFEVELLCATDGNHGRAIARMGELLGLPARIWVPQDVTAASRSLIASHGNAQVCIVQGDYDQAVRTASEEANRKGARNGAVLVQDTAWEGYEETPSWIVDGYTTLFDELDEQLANTGKSGISSSTKPDLVVCPAGVGSLAHGAVRHYRSKDLPPSTAPSLLLVESTVSACLLASLLSGKSTTVEAGRTAMAGLNCGTPSALGWLDLRAGVDGAIAVTDEEALSAMRDLTKMPSNLRSKDSARIDVGPCGAAPLAALRKLLKGTDGEHARKTLGLDERATVVLISTEGGETYRGGAADLA